MRLFIKRQDYIERRLYQEVWIKDNIVAAVKPKAEYEPFLSSIMKVRIRKWRPRWGSGHTIPMDL